jgi:hypothetical protein
MPWKNNNGDVSDSRPTRVRLPESDTRTAEAVTDEVLAEAGWYWEEPVVVVYEPEYVAEVITDYVATTSEDAYTLEMPTESVFTDGFTATESFTVTDSITL